MTELKPCPFCQSTLAAQSDLGQGRMAVVCMCCMAVGPETDFPDHAEIATSERLRACIDRAYFLWNTRVQSPGLDRELLLQHLEVEQYKLTMLYPKSAHGIKKLCSRLKIFIKDGEFDAITTGEIDK